MGKTVNYRNYHAISAWFRNSAGPMKSKKYKNFKQNWREILKEEEYNSYSENAQDSELSPEEEIKLEKTLKELKK